MKRVFLIGSPVAHSVSPAMQHAAFRALGLDWQYELLETPKAALAPTVARLRAADCAGANVTLPYKEEVLPWLDDVTDRARQIGAVNTIVRRDGRLIGDNTDGDGFTRCLRDAGVDPRNKLVAILGAGGAARAVAVATAELGAARLVLFNRTLARAESLAAFLRAGFSHVAIAVNDVSALVRSDLIVNATSVGMSPREDESPMPAAFPRGAVAVDLVYRPAETKFLRDAARAGAPTVGGLGMLVYQGAAAFKLWTERDAPVDVMRAAAETALHRTARAIQNP
jgi:shikimate dehydrogenase